MKMLDVITDPCYNQSGTWPKVVALFTTNLSGILNGFFLNHILDGDFSVVKLIPTRLMRLLYFLQLPKTVLNLVLQHGLQGIVSPACIIMHSRKPSFVITPAVFS